MVTPIKKSALHLSRIDKYVFWGIRTPNVLLTLLHSHGNVTYLSHMSPSIFKSPTIWRWLKIHKEENSRMSNILKLQKLIKYQISHFNQIHALNTLKGKDLLLSSYYEKISQVQLSLLLLFFFIAFFINFFPRVLEWSMEKLVKKPYL